MSSRSAAPALGVREWIVSTDRKIVGFLSEYSILFLRLALAVTFIWFGVLKVIGSSPVADLVAQTLPWLPPEIVVPIIGVWEIFVGFGLLTRFALRVTLLFFFVQMAGTFLVLATQPELAFQNGNPLLLTTIGEFVIKNLVLVSAGLVIGATVRKPSETV
jgi:uncharacterized membrane protein YkgB